LKFSLCCLTHVLVVLHIPTGDTPGPFIDAARAPSQHNMIPLHDDHGHTNHRIVPENKLTRRTHQAFTPVQPLACQSGTTARTIPVRPRHGWPDAVGYPLARLCCMLHCTSTCVKPVAFCATDC